MSPDELAKAVADTVAKAQARVGPNSIGAQQYWREGEPQKFETLTWEEWYDYMEEEALDIVNYGVMLTIRINRMRYLFKGVDEIA